jgi:hypothetical protein
MDNTFPVRSQKNRNQTQPCARGKAIAANQRQIEPQITSLDMGVNLA